MGKLLFRDGKLYSELGKMIGETGAEVHKKK